MQVEHLNIYIDKGLMVTNEIRVKFRGENSTSDITYSHGPPSLTGNAIHLASARNPERHNVFEEKFSFHQGSYRVLKLSVMKIDPDIIEKIKEIGLTLLIGYLVIQLLVILVKRLLFRRISKQSKMLISKGIVYAGIIVLIFLLINILELKGVLKTLLGAAGVLGIILGIASQNSIGNIMSGIFLVSERPFELGDLIRVGDKRGYVYSIDLLSIKLRTLDNLLIRIPNQTIINTEVTNVTRFPIRRLDIELGIAYKENIQNVVNLLKKVAKENPLCLKEPEPMVMVRRFGPSSIDLLFGVWFERTKLVKVKNSIYHEITQAFAREGIEIPFPHVTIYTGEATRPLPVKVLNEEANN